MENVSENTDESVRSNETTHLLYPTPLACFFMFAHADMSFLFLLTLGDKIMNIGMLSL